MLKIKENANNLDYNVVFSTQEGALKMLKIMRWNSGKTNKKINQIREEAIAHLKKHNYSDETIEDLLTQSGFNKGKKVSKLPGREHAKRSKQVQEHVDFLHNHDHLKSWVCLAQIDYSMSEDGWAQWHYRNDEIADHIIKILYKNTSTYMSVNEFRTTSRNALSVRYMTSFYADIDAHEEGVEVDLKAIKRFLNKKYKDGKLPKHSRLTATGRGVQVYWKLETVPDCLYWMWCKLEGYIVQELADIKDHIKGHEVDLACVDVSRVFRVEGTMNPKAGEVAKCIDKNDNIYRMSDILKQYFEDKIIITKKKAKHQVEMTDEKGYVIELNDKKEQKFAIVRQRRLHDLRKLLELRKNQIQQGHREEFLWIYAWTCVENITTERMIHKELSSVNSMFVDPLSATELNGIVRKVYRKWTSRKLKQTAWEGSLSAQTGRYCFRNKTIIDKLDITEFERSYFETIFLTEEESQKVWNERRNTNKKEARRSGKKKQTTREKEADVNRRKVQRWKAKGLSQSEVQKKTGLGISTVKRYWN